VKENKKRENDKVETERDGCAIFCKLNLCYIL